MKQAIDNLGFSQYWYFGNADAKMYPTFFERAKDQFIQIWKAEISECSKLEYYCKYKTCFMFEPYLSNIKNYRIRVELTRFRLSAHSLAIETGRFLNIDRKDRICLFCNQRKVESEFHFLLICTKFRDLRSKYLNSCNTFPTIYKFINIMSSTSNKTQINLAKYIKIAMERRCLETN